MCYYLLDVLVSSRRPMISPCNFFQWLKGKCIEIYIVRKNESISYQLFINGVGCS